MHTNIIFQLSGHHDEKLRINSTGTTALKWWATLQDQVERWTNEVEDIDIPDFEETVKAYGVFRAKESRRASAREERNRRRKTVLDLERPEFGKRKSEMID